MTEDHFAGEIARTYDAVTAAWLPDDATDTAVDQLASLAGGGAALEFAIGTGRVGLPLVDRGIRVAGIELSSDMVDQLRSKPGSDAIDVTIGDMTTARVDGEFALVYLVFNTVTNLTTQDAQVACFENAARHLRPGGRFLVECIVPPLQRLPVGEQTRTFRFTEERIGVDELDVVTQAATSHHFVRRHDGRFDRWSMPWRYVWPSELDLMARIAGMTLEYRWSSFERDPFTATSESHVSVWRRSD